MALDYDHADDCAYQLRALLRTMEARARSISEEPVAHNHISAASDLALLCELGGGLCETVHDMMQMLHQKAVKP